MRIVSLNAWGGALYDALADWVPDCGADVLCLQEVTHTPGLGGWTEFRDSERTLPQRANLFEDIRQLLPAYQASFVVSDAGPVIDRRGKRHHQDFGLALFVKAEHPMIGQSAGFIHGSFVDHDDWVATDRPRIAQGVRLIDRTRRRAMAVFHAHGLRDSSGKGDTPARWAQARALATLIEQGRGDEDLTVMAGDLNVLPDSKTFEVLAAIGLVDLVGTQDTRTQRYTKPIRHANYLLVSDTDEVRQFHTPESPEVSDHRMLILDL